MSSVYGAARDTGQAVAADVGWKGEKVSPFILLLIASLNCSSIGIFNLLPLLPMDGGRHAAVVLCRRWCGRGSPGGCPSGVQ